MTEKRKIVFFYIFTYNFSKIIFYANFVLIITNTKKNYLIWCSRSEVMRVHTFQWFIYIYIYIYIYRNFYYTSWYEPVLKSSRCINWTFICQLLLNKRFIALFIVQQVFKKCHTMCIIVIHNGYFTSTNFKSWLFSRFFVLKSYSKIKQVCGCVQREQVNTDLRKTERLSTRVCDLPAQKNRSSVQPRVF